MPRDPTPPPSDLDTDSKALWKKRRKQLQDQGTWQDSDVDLFERYIRALELARCAREARRGAGGKLQLTASGSQGQTVQHPNIKTEREAQRDAHEYAKELLLTPLARLRHEIEEKAAAEAASKFGGRL